MKPKFKKGDIVVIIASILDDEKKFINTIHSIIERSKASITNEYIYKLSDMDEYDSEQWRGEELELYNATDLEKAIYE